MSKTIFLITYFFIAVILADNNDIDLCIQKKLKVSTPVSHVQLQTGDFTKIPYAARSALQICHPTFDIVAVNVFKKMLKPQVMPSEIDVKCFKTHLLKKNAEGLLVEAFDKNLLNGFDGDSNCAEIIENFTNNQIKQKMPYGTPSEIQCLKNSIDMYMSARFKAQILAAGDYSVEIINDEKQRFARELREVSEELIECLVELK
ncbi:hypothetical protein PVAND_014479 [Polypedilum vanderplanki]|uniref:Uncharacterized protein n=1 Tax=Polypedilum vanderplanki TaxID=319348 RepID=A0A9J6BAB2_POLVA|nr:hypothetical protein PVAND_014479 [Polypedilum vanderplanki]